jgi:hypothetical protein
MGIRQKQTPRGETEVDDTVVRGRKYTLSLHRETTHIAVRQTEKAQWDETN